MKKFFVAILVLITAMYVGAKIVQDPGYAYFSYGEYSVEMPLWLTLVSLLGLMFLAGLIVALYKNMGRIAMRIRRRRERRQRLKLMRKTRLGMVSFLEGDYQKSEKLLAQGVDQSTPPFINYVYSALAAFAQNDEIRGSEYLQLAKKAEPAASDAVDILIAKSDVDQRRFGQALETLRRLSDKNKNALVALKTLYVTLNDWPGLIVLLPKLKKHLPHTEYADLQKTVYTKLMEDAQTLNLDAMKHAWHSMPRVARKDPEIITQYARGLVHFEDYNLAESLLRDTLKKHWSDDLISLYGKLHAYKPEKLLKTAEKYLSAYPENAALLLALGRLCQQCQQWGKAKDYLEASLRAAPHVDTKIALAKLHESLNDTPKALQYYKEATQ